MGNLAFFKQAPAPKPLLAELKQDLAQSRRELNLAYDRFNQAKDPELVESCIYQINAMQHRCNYLLRAIKEAEGQVLAAGTTGGEATWI